MPSPGQSSIAGTLGAKTYTVDGGFDTQFNEQGTFVQKLATAIDSGWTCATPTTSTSMASAFDAELANYLAGQGKQFVDCIAAGIDTEIDAWVASWDTKLQIHTFVVSAAGIVSRIQACAPIWSAGAQAVAESAADAFMSGFGQEVG